jgi:hypothetical protein
MCTTIGNAQAVLQNLLRQESCKSAEKSADIIEFLIKPYANN